MDIYHTHVYSERNTGITKIQLMPKKQRYRTVILRIALYKQSICMNEGQVKQAGFQLKRGLRFEPGKVGTMIEDQL